MLVVVVGRLKCEILYGLRNIQFPARPKHPVNPPINSNL